MIHAVPIFSKCLTASLFGGPDICFCDPIHVFCSCTGRQLYDLMTMALKYQVLLCPRPKDVLLVTFNHLDAIKGFIRDNPALVHLVDETSRQLIEVRYHQFITSQPQYLFSFLCKEQEDSVRERTG